MNHIKLMAEYGGTVLWWNGDGKAGPIEVDALPLSAALKLALHSWAESYDRTLNSEYPPNSGFNSRSEVESFEADGVRLCRALQNELGSEFEVIYRSVQ